MQLAEALGSSQRALSRDHHRRVPPATVVIALAKALRVFTDELLGVRVPRASKPDPGARRLWKTFRRVLTLPEKDHRAIIRMINSLSSRPTTDHPA